MKCPVAPTLARMPLSDVYVHKSMDPAVFKKTLSECIRLYWNIQLSLYLGAMPSAALGLQVRGDTKCRADNRHCQQAIKAKP